MPLTREEEDAIDVAIEVLGSDERIVTIGLKLQEALKHLILEHQGSQSLVSFYEETYKKAASLFSLPIPVASKKAPETKKLSLKECIRLIIRNAGKKLEKSEQQEKAGGVPVNKVSSSSPEQSPIKRKTQKPRQMPSPCTSPSTSKSQSCCDDDFDQDGIPKTPDIAKRTRKRMTPPSSSSPCSRSPTETQERATCQSTPRRERDSRVEPSATPKGLPGPPGSESPSSQIVDSPCNSPSAQTSALPSPRPSTSGTQASTSEKAIYIDLALADKTKLRTRRLPNNDIIPSTYDAQYKDIMRLKLNVPWTQTTKPFVYRKDNRGRNVKYDAFVKVRSCRGKCPALGEPCTFVEAGTNNFKAHWNSIHPEKGYSTDRYIDRWFTVTEFLEFRENSRLQRPAEIDKRERLEKGKDAEQKASKESKKRQRKE